MGPDGKRIGLDYSGVKSDGQPVRHSVVDVDLHFEPFDWATTNPEDARGRAGQLAHPRAPTADELAFFAR